MASTSTSSAHIQQLVALATTHHYAGLEIDYEGLWTGADRAPYTAFMQQLTAAMHAAGKQVSAAVPALTDTAVTNAWDYSVLSAELDVLHIMGYDFHWLGGDHPGPGTPLGWDQEGTAQAQATGRGQKFILGVPNYGVGGPYGGCAGSDCPATCTSTYATATNHMMMCPYGSWSAGRAPNCSTSGGILYFDDVTSTEEK